MLIFLTSFTGSNKFLIYFVFQDFLLEMSGVANWKSMQLI